MYTLAPGRDHRNVVLYNFFVFFLFRPHSQPYGRPPSMGPSLLMAGIVCILIGLAVIAAPELIAYFVAGIFIFVGLSLLGAWWRMR